MSVVTDADGFVGIRFRSHNIISGTTVSDLNANSFAQFTDARINKFGSPLNA